MLPTPPDPAPYRRVFGVCPACGGTLAPPDWTDTQWLRHGHRRCSSCRRLVVPAREGRIIEEATPRAVAVRSNSDSAEEVTPDDRP